MSNLALYSCAWMLINTTPKSRIVLACVCATSRIACNSTVALSCLLTNLAAPAATARVRVSTSSCMLRITLAARVRVASTRSFCVTDFDNVRIPVNDLAEWQHLVNWAKQNFESVPGIPLLIKNRGYGGIALYFRDLCYPLSAEDTALAMSFANQAALAIENARLYAQASDSVFFSVQSKLSISTCAKVKE